MSKGFKGIMQSPKDIDLAVAVDETPRAAHLYANEKEIPEIKEWKVGETYDIKVRMISRTTSEKEPWSAEFEVINSDANEEAEGDDTESDEE